MILSGKDDNSVACMYIYIKSETMKAELLISCLLREIAGFPKPSETKIEIVLINNLIHLPRRFCFIPK